jgi:hypothetical protein
MTSHFAMERIVEDDYQLVLREKLQAYVDWSATIAESKPTHWRYSSLEQFVLLNGKSYQPQTLPRKYYRGRMGICFENAYRSAKRHGLVYVEGYALSGSADKHHHAWCAEPGSPLVIDRTWGNGKAYLGVAFDLRFVSRPLKSRRGCFGVLDDAKVLSLPDEEWKYRG